MQRFSVSVLGLITVLFLVLALGTGCGGNDDNGTTGPTPAKVVLQPSTLSLGFGTFQSTVPTVLNANDEILSGFVFTFKSSNTEIATVSPSGEVCAGAWDTNFQVCTPKPCPNGAQACTAEVTVSAAGLTSAPVKVYLHRRVDRITVSPLAPACRSQEESVEFTATAFSNNEDVTADIGPVSWRSGQAGIAELSTTDLPNNKVKATAKLPGRATISASLQQVNSVPASFLTCPPASIVIQEKDGTETSFELATGTTKQLEAEVIDTAGKPMTGLTLTWRSTEPSAVGITTAGLINPLGPGYGAVVASCSAPGCTNLNEAHFSNLVRVRVTGDTETTVYAASTSGKKLVPIPTGTHTPGTAVDLPFEPNSFLFAPHGVRAYLGSSEALMVLSASSNTIAQHSAVKGRVLATSPTRAVISDTTNSKVYVWNDVDQNVLATLDLAGVTDAAISLDESRIFLLGGSTLYVWSPTAPTLRTIALSVPASRVALLGNSALAYFAGGTPDNIMVRDVCDTDLVHSVTTATPPERMAGLPDGSGILAVNPPSMQHISVTLSGQTCDPTVVDTVANHDFGVGGFTPRQIIVTPDSKFAFITSERNELLVYDVAAGTTSTIALAAGATESFTGGATLDARNVYVGSDHGVHRINVADAQDAQQIDLDFTADLVAVRPD